MTGYGELLQLTELCQHDSTIQNVYESGCADLSCVCQSDEVLTKLLYDLLRKCNPTDQEGTLSAWRIHATGEEKGVNNDLTF